LELDQGKDADIVILDEQLKADMTFCRGELAYHRGGEQQ
jgi:N-acetylglucosamine-6-phosphate deacetylase